MLWLVAALAGAATAQAQPAPPATGSDQLARTRFEQGREAYKDGRYRDAWAYFHEAYQLSGRPELLFNIGQTADRLGQVSEALKAFTMYLERLPEAANRRDVENRVRALRERADSSAAAPAPPTPLGPPPAQTPPEPRRHVREAPPPPPPAESSSGHPPRRGLYLRAALGFGFRSNTASTSNGASVSFFGWGFAFDLAAGYAVLPGFVLGGGIFFDGTTRPTLRGEGDSEVALDHANVFTIGPFVDWYPKRENLGWHVLGGIGIGAMGYRTRGGDSGTPSGFDIIVGGGYEWPVSGPLALGAMLRLTLGFLSDRVESHTFFAPSLAMSGTWF